MSGWLFQIGPFCRGGNWGPKSEWQDSLSQSLTSLSTWTPFLIRLSDHGILLTSLICWPVGLSSLSHLCIHTLSPEAQRDHPWSPQPLPAPQCQSSSICTCITQWPVAPGCPGEPLKSCLQHWLSAGALDKSFSFSECISHLFHGELSWDKRLYFFHYV